MIGEDSGIDGLDDIAFVFSDINLHGNKKGYLAVLGPTRLNYPKVIPLVDFFSHSLNQVISGW